MCSNLKKVSEWVLSDEGQQAIAKILQSAHENSERLNSAGQLPVSVYIHTEFLICPHCKNVHSSATEFFSRNSGGGYLECIECGESFKVSRVFSTFYVSEKVTL